MPPRDPQPGEKYRFRKRKAIDSWEYLEVIRVWREPFTLGGMPFEEEPGVQYKPAVHHPELGIPKCWGRRISEVPCVSGG
jgi:hypothetical protein